jgi:hypothetical protein
LKTVQTGQIMRNLMPDIESKAVASAKLILTWLQNTEDPSKCTRQISDAEFILLVLEKYQKDLLSEDILVAQLKMENDLLRRKLDSIRKILTS